jgi:NedA-like, galactose-binding domain/Alpha-L-fucosidase
MHRSRSACCFIVWLALSCQAVDGHQRSTNTGHRANWLAEAKWGLFVHYLADTVAAGDGTTVEQWNKAVDSFDVDAYAKRLAKIGANYTCITLGQNSGHFIAPNATYDELVGISPSKCSRRDLVSDLADALAKHDLKLMVYLPSGAPDRDQIAVAKLGWKKGQHPFYSAKAPGQIDRNHDLIGFQEKWDRIVCDWSHRWGHKVAGWWFDGCYFVDEMYLLDDPPNFGTLAAAARGGNQASIVAFNSGVIPQHHPARNPQCELTSLSPHEDYTAGEVADEMIQCHGPRIGAAQFHILSYLGTTWGHGQPRFRDRWVIEYVREINHNGGAVMWDVPVAADGTIPKQFVDQLEALGKGLAQPRPMTPPGNLASYKPAKLLDLSGENILAVNGARHFARHGVDGDQKTRAQAGGEWPWTYQVDLIAQTRVGKIVVSFPEDCYPTEYQILLAPDGGNGDDWQIVAHETILKPGRYTHTFNPTPARFVRVQGIKPDGPDQTGRQMAVAELEAYAADRGK